MKYISTRATASPDAAQRGFSDILLEGLAPDGGLYLPTHYPAVDSAMLDRWRTIKLAANEAVTSLGGTITHHHAVGRDHRPMGYDLQVPPLFREAFAGARQALDPTGIMNPGVVLDTPHRGAVDGGVLRHPS